MDDYNSIYSGEEIDERLTAVGRKIELPSSAYAGKVPRANSMGGVDWINIGQPTDAQTAAAINAWLAAHPEATTTVQDGAVTTAKIADGAVTMAKLAGGTYNGVDLTAAHAAEIGTQNPWAWIKSRIQAANYSGIHIGDYIPFTAGGNTYQAQVAGIDIYYRYGSTAVGHHIDFITRQLWADSHAFNTTATNNGTSSAPSPWMASGIRNWLNSTVYNALPFELQAVIVGKTFWAEKRYSSAGALTSSAGAGWYDLGNLWLPTEVEVFGYPMVGTPYVSAQGSMGQYPIFSGTSARGKSKVGSGRNNWWLMTAADGGSAHFVAISNYGCGTALSAASAAFVPICFRIA